jgi:hypothetical protein
LRDERQDTRENGVKPQAKVSRVMREFKQGELKSSSGQKVTNPKQAIAIGLSEAGISKKAKGGEMKESMKKVKEEVAFMKKKGAPKSMVKHEMAEAGGAFQPPKYTPQSGTVQRPSLQSGTPNRVPARVTSGTPNRVPARVTRRGMAKGGLAAGHKSADGVAVKGKTKGKEIVMKGAGKGMKKGGYC